MNLHTSRYRILLLTAAAVFAAACGQPTAHASTQYGGAQARKASPSPPPVTPSPAEPALPTAQGGPLPGQNLPISAPLSYPLLIQIENTPPSRPQAGLQAASVVFEYITEADITRFSALFHRVPGVVGPVRSARFISIYLYHRYGALLMASGGGVNVYHRIFSEPGTHALINDFDPSHFFRWSGRAAPHNVYTTQAQMVQAGTTGARPPRVGDFLRSNIWPGTQSAPAVDIADMRSHFAWADGSYTITTDGIPQTDVIYGDLRAQAIVVMHVPQHITAEIHDVNGTLGRDFDFKPGGAADTFAKGTVVHGTWASPGEFEPLQLKDAAGKPLGLPPGLVWVVVEP